MTRLLRRNYRRIGDVHRDLCEWKAAEEAYRRHLRQKPDDVAIWVQLGHMLKEQGRLKPAISAYEHATILDPNNDDAVFQFAEALRANGDHERAMSVLDNAYLLHPSGSMVRELAVAQRNMDALPRTIIGSGAVVFTVQDLLAYLKAHQTMSGIQRVQAGIALAAIDDPQVDGYFVINETPTVRPAPGEYLLLDRDILRKTIVYASGEHVSHAALRKMLAECEDASVPARLERGSTLVLLGAFWGHGNTMERFSASSREGVRIGLYIYDLIPISHPEYCDERLVRDFTFALCEALFLADFVLTISDYTRLAVGEFLRKHGGRHIPMATVPLAHSMTDARRPSGRLPDALAKLKNRKFVSYVSTIEGRKNHLYVLNAWRQMISDGVPVPDLVFVGRKGWRIDTLVAALDATANLDGKVHIVHDLSDAELTEVYASSLFCVFTSFIEGWGLPIGEALAQGTPCVVSSTSSMPEVGGKFVDYIDPYNLRDGIAAFKRLINDERYRAERRRLICEGFTPRNWLTVSEDFIAKVRDMSQTPITKKRPVRLSDGIVFRSNSFFSEALPDLSEYLLNPTRLLLRDFYPSENHGAWLRGTSGAIEINTDGAVGDRYAIYLRLGIAPWAADCKIRLILDSGGNSGIVTSFTAQKLSSQGTVRLLTALGDGGKCVLSMMVEGAFSMPVNDHRIFAVGLIAIGCSPVNDHVSRQNIMEELTLLTVGL